MKRIICLITALCLVFGSFSLVFAAEWSSSDISSVVNDVTQIRTTLNNIYTRLGTISGYLYDSGHSIAYWVSAIDSWMQPIYTSLTSNLAANLNLEPIISGLNEVVSVPGGGTTYYPYLRALNNNGWGNSTAAQGMYTTNWDGSVSTYNFTPSTNWQQNMALLFQFMNNNITQSFAGMNYKLHSDAWGIAVLKDPLTLQEARTSYISTDHMLELYLQNIGTSAARLSYVLASPERIEAQEAAADNEEAVVDNFIDSNGAGSASTSDIASVSDLSSGYQQNFGTDASVSGIFNIFNSNNMGWFSSETFNQLDTTQNTRKGNSIDTPLLDQQINDIYKAIGLENYD